MTCQNCGAPLESTDTSCPDCTTPVAAPADPSVTQPMTDPSTSEVAREDTTVGAGARAGGATGAGSGGATGSSSGSAEPTEPPSRGPVGGHPALGTPGAAAWQQVSAHPSGLSSETRGWGIAAHLLGLGGALLTVVTLGFAGPLVVWLLRRADHPFIDHHAKESLNFQLTTLVALVVGALAAIPVFLLGFLTLGVLWLVAIIAVLAATVVWFVFPIVGAVKAANGEGYRYPVSIRFVR